MANKNKQTRGHIFISGRVQGVAFRYYSQKTAQKLGVTGWTRNCMNGKVEIMVEGEKENVIQFIDWCHVGPWSAIVENVDIIWENYRGEFVSFNIRG